MSQHDTPYPCRGLTVRRLVATAACLALLGPACSPGGAETNPTPPPIGGTTAPSPSPTPSPTPNPTATPVDVTQIPDDPSEIDETYIQAVIDALDARIADAYSVIANERARTERVVAALQSVFTPAATDGQLDSIEQNIGYDSIAESPEPPQSTVREIFTATPDCLFFSADRHLESLLSPNAEAEFQPVQPYYVMLREAQQEDGPTAWKIHISTFVTSGEVPADPCEEEQ